MPTRFLILGKDVKPQKATKPTTAMSKAATMAVENPGIEIHLYEFHTSFRHDPEPTQRHEQRSGN
jgi:hypothetical protein